MRAYFIFLAGAAALAVLLLTSSYHYVPCLLFALYFIRLLFLQDSKLLLYSLLTFLFFSVWTHYHMQSHRTILKVEDSKFLIDLELDSVKINGDQLQFYGEDTRGERLVVFYQLKSQQEKHDWEKGKLKSQVRVEGELKKPKGHQNFYDFSYRQFLFHKNIHWLLQAEELSASSQQLQIWRIDHWRERLFRFIDQRFTPHSASYIKALLFADRRYFDQETTQKFQQMGIVHLLSISGMHLGFLISSFRYLYLRMGFTKEKLPYFLFGFLTVYGCLCAWSVSVFRAISQSHLRSMNQLARWELSSLDIWSLSFIFALVYQPFFIFQPAFQLSYLLSFSLLFYNDLAWVKKRTEFQKTFFTSLYLALWSLPILIYHYHGVSLLSVFFNLLFIPLFTYLLLPLLLFFFSLSFILYPSQLFHILLVGLDQFLLYFEAFISMFSPMSWAYLVAGKLNSFIFILLVLLLIVCMIQLEQDKMNKKTFILALSILFFLLNSNRLSLATRILFINVGQGDAIVVQQPFWKKDFMIDTGGRLEFEKESWQVRSQRSNLAERTLITSLHSMGIKKLDYLFISHGDADHCGEMLELTGSFSIDNVVLSSESLRHSNLKSDLLAMNSQVKQINILKHTDLPYLIDENWLVIWPDEKTPDSNESSLVIYGKIAGESWLFTADIGHYAEQQLLSTYPQLQADNLKIGHHGSSTSTNEKFLDHLQAKRAIISVGENNRYHHPSLEVIDSLKRRQIEILRTDQDGAILFTYYPWSNQPIIKNVQSLYEEE